MHPLKAAIELLHNESARLHEATKDFEFTAEEKDKLIDVLLGFIPGAIDAAQGFISAVVAFIATR